MQHACGDQAVTTALINPCGDLRFKWTQAVTTALIEHSALGSTPTHLYAGSHEAVEGGASGVHHLVAGDAGAVLATVPVVGYWSLQR